jgi:hypothetical protein
MDTLLLFNNCARVGVLLSSPARLFTEKSCIPNRIIPYSNCKSTLAKSGRLHRSPHQRRPVFTADCVWATCNKTYLKIADSGVCTRSPSSVPFASHLCITQDVRVCDITLKGPNTIGQRLRTSIDSLRFVSLVVEGGERGEGNQSASRSILWIRRHSYPQARSPR